ncbi:MAG: VWA domain-containing protein [Acidobacteria bacterium]|nr:VWA domain-containing protein [Acidobacteriota bacterium]
MKLVRRQMTNRARRVWTAFGLSAMALAFLIFSHPGRAQQQTQTQQDSRPRRVGPNAVPTPPKISGVPPAPGATPTPTPEDPNGVELDEGDTVKVDTNLVNLNVRVIDRNNRTVNDVRQDEFRVYEDGVLQKIEFASKEEVPISYGLAIDNSGSLRSQINKVIEAGKTIINSNKPGDETFLMRFVSSDKIEVKQDFSSDKGVLTEVLEDFYPEGGQTAVIDAIYLAAEHVAEYKKGNDLEDRRRRALIVVTDGEDRVSYYSQEALFERLREEDVQIFVIGFVGELDDEKKGFIIRKSVKSKAVNLINKLAEETGGRAFFPNSLNDLPGIAEEITRDMRTQYVIGYYPTNDRRDGSYRAIRIGIGDATGRDKRIAITRPGRTAPRDSVTTTNTPPRTNNVKPTTSGRKP